MTLTFLLWLILGLTILALLILFWTFVAELVVWYYHLKDKRRRTEQLKLVLRQARYRRKQE